MMDETFLRELQKQQNHVAPVEAFDRKYVALPGKQELIELRPRGIRRGKIRVNTVTGLVNALSWIEKSREASDNETIERIEIRSTQEIVAVITGGQLREEEAIVLATAESRDRKNELARGVNPESLIIALRAGYALTPDAGYLLELVSKMTLDKSIEYTDDGMTQSVAVRDGIRKVSEKPIKPILELRPYRTFPDFESWIDPKTHGYGALYICRAKGKDQNLEISLHEANPGAWEIENKQQIEKYLLQLIQEAKLKDKPVILA